MALDRKQQRRDQNILGCAFVATLLAQIALSFSLAELLALTLPAATLGIVAAILALRSESALLSLQPKRRFLVIASLGFATLFGLTFLVEDPRSVLMMRLSQMGLIDFACVGLGRLSASLIAGNRAALG